MKKLFMIVVLLTITGTINVFANTSYTEAEILSMCGVPVDLDEMDDVDIQQNSMYQQYLTSLSSKSSSSSLSWQSYMSDIDDQQSEEC